MRNKDQILLEGLYDNNISRYVNSEVNKRKFQNRPEIEERTKELLKNTIEQLKNEMRTIMRTLEGADGMDEQTYTKFEEEEGDISNLIDTIQNFLNDRNPNFNGNPPEGSTQPEDSEGEMSRRYEDSQRGIDPGQY
jgi:molecular chaperone DnaK (HSP70)